MKGLFNSMGHSIKKGDIVPINQNLSLYKFSSFGFKINTLELENNEENSIQFDIKFNKSEMELKRFTIYKKTEINEKYIV